MVGRNCTARYVHGMPRLLFSCQPLNVHFRRMLRAPHSCFLEDASNAEGECPIREKISWRLLLFVG